MRLVRVVLAAATLFTASVALSFVHPGGKPRSGVGTDTPLLDGTAVPADVLHVLETKCADCHSENTNWPAYSRLAPVSWLIEHDVREGREHLNMSQWQRYTSEARIDLLSRIASEARSGQMPLRQYWMLHPQARLSSEEQQLIYDWAKSEHKHIRHQIAGGEAKP
jgi:cytochrome c